MNTQFLIANELAALLVAPIALMATWLATEKYKGRILIFGQVAALVFALSGSACALSHTGFTTDFVNFGIRLEAVSSCLLVGITFIAAVVVAFSDRYLLGDRTRISFMRFLSLLSSIAGFLVVTNCLFVAFACWTALSFGLWGVMRLRADSRDEASVVLRYHLLSDAALLAAVVLVANSGVFTFTGLVDKTVLSGGLGAYGGTAVSLLLVLAFSVKSALFPFHKWLLATLQAPTPLSGLLHAGVVNVSAVLAWRMMPILHEHSYVLLVWGLWSATSAIVGTLSMSAQPDVKRKLVYSTSGQMGFMSLQCATGMPGAAIFHLLAHGLFKCHMFLQSGSAVAEGVTKRQFGYADETRSGSAKLTSMAFVGFATIVFGFLITYLSGWNWTSLSAAIAAVALLSAVPALNRVDFGSLSLFWMGTLALAMATAVGSRHFENLLQTDYSLHVWPLPSFLALSITFVLALKVLRKSRIAKALYVHSLNGFYAGDLGMGRKAKRV